MVEKAIKSTNLPLSDCKLKKIEKYMQKFRKSCS